MIPFVKIIWQRNRNQTLEAWQIINSEDSTVCIEKSSCYCSLSGEENTYCNCKSCLTTSFLSTMGMKVVQALLATLIPCR